MLVFLVLVSTLAEELDNLMDSVGLQLGDTAENCQHLCLVDSFQGNFLSRGIILSTSSNLGVADNLDSVELELHKRSLHRFLAGDRYLLLQFFLVGFQYRVRWVCIALHGNLLELRRHWRYEFFIQAEWLLRVCLHQSLYLLESLEGLPLIAHASLVQSEFAGAQDLAVEHVDQVFLQDVLSGNLGHDRESNHDLMQLEGAQRFLPLRLLG